MSPESEKTAAKANNADAETCYRRFLAGDKDGLDDLVTIYGESLTLFVHGIVHDMTEAKAIMMDAFAQLVISAGQFRGSSSIKTYLYTIGRNLALRYCKEQKRRQSHVSFDDGHETAHSAADDSVENTFIKEESKRQLYESMKGLKPDYSEILHLLYFADMSYAEAGRVMKKSETQITSLAYRAKAALRKKLEERGFTFDA